MTKVIFYIDPPESEDTDVFAYFPDDNYDEEGYLKTSYSHIGQHSACHPDYIQSCRRATEEEYRVLQQELTNLGYKLKIL